MKRLATLEMMRNCATSPEARLAAMRVALHENYDAAEVFEVFAATDDEVAALDRLLRRTPGA